MEEITVPKYIIKNFENALRLAANTLDSRERKTAADRQIEYAERLAKWLLSGKIGDVPKWIP